MLGDTLTITLDGSGGTAKVLPKVNQDGYSSEYYLDETTQWFRCKIRHTADTVKAGALPVERHTVTFSRYTKPTVSLPLGSLSEVIFTIKNDSAYLAADTIDISEAMSFYMVKAGGIAARLLGKES